MCFIKGKSYVNEAYLNVFLFNEKSISRNENIAKRNLIQKVILGWESMKNTTSRDTSLG